jgi:hypothetical protein
MDNNPLTTLPYFTDRLRTKGTHNPPQQHINYYVPNSSNPENKEFYDDWRQEAKRTAYEQLNSSNKSKVQFLTPNIYPKGSGNRASAPFGASSNQDFLNFDIHYSNAYKHGMKGRGNPTQSSSISYDLRDAYNKKALLRRAEGFDSIQENSINTSGIKPSQGVDMVEFSNAKKSADLLLSSIEERVNSGIIDYTTFKDLLNVIMFYQRYIWVFDDAGYLGQLLERLELLERTVVESEFNEESKDVQYADAFQNSLKKLIQYIRANISFVGRSEAERKQKASSTNKQLTNKYIQQAEVQQLYENIAQPEFQSDKLERDVGHDGNYGNLFSDDIENLDFGDMDFDGEEGGEGEEAGVHLPPAPAPAPRQTLTRASFNGLDAEQIRDLARAEGMPRYNPNLANKRTAEDLQKMKTYVFLKLKI